MKPALPSILSALVCAAFPALLPAQSTTTGDNNFLTGGSFNGGYESEHIFRGFDSGLGGAIAWSSFTLQTEPGFDLGIWYGSGFRTAYEEFDLFGGYTARIGDFSVRIGATWYHFPSEEVADDSTDFLLDVYREIPISDALTLTPYLSAVYNESAEGFYGELGTRATMALHPSVILSARAYAAASTDYRTNGSGMDHLGLILSAPLSLTETASLVPFVGQTLALDEAESAGAIDESWGGVTLSVTF